MLVDHASIDLLEILADGLHAIDGLEFIFVGGALTCIYIDDDSMGQIRSTKDVDCTVELASFIAYSKMEERLRQRGFRNVVSENAPLCRWIYKSVLVDIMPDDENIIGFSNSWYKEGRMNKKYITLPSGVKIAIFPVEYFLASKIEAFFSRGNNDFYGSKDLEDIITILDGTKDLSNMLNTANRAVDFVKKTFSKFSLSSLFLQSLAAHIEYGDVDRAERVLTYMKSFDQECT